MSAFKRVVLAEKDNSVVESVDSNTTTDAVQKQVNNFDTDYTDKKLNYLYKEFDSITVNETDLLNDVQEQKQAKAKMSAKSVIRLVSASIVAALLTFLAIYNIFVINGLKNDINIINGDITNSEVQLDSAKQTYNTLTDTTDIESELAGAGYSSIDDMTKVHITLPEYNGAQSAQVSTNWWDSFCNFIASIFGR